MSEYICPKCNAEVSIAYDGVAERIRCRCRKCGYNWDEEPKDRKQEAQTEDGRINLYD